jgi:pimeloyl-ACP methyl ester carboxylesterase
MTGTSTNAARSSVDVRYYLRGALDRGTPVVFVHGVGSSASGWDAVIDALPEDIVTVTYDLRGHGSSPAPGGVWTVDDFVEDHVRLLHTLGMDKCHLVGFSLGGLIAQRIAATYPETVDRLVIIGAVAGRTTEERERVLERLAMVERVGPAGAARQSVARWYSPDYLAAHPETHHLVVERMERLNAAAYARAYRVLATTDLADDLHRIKAPILVMTGENDVGSPPRMAELMATATGGRLVIVPGSRHEVLEEAPELIAKEITTHVR